MAFTKKRRSGDWLKGMYVGLYCYCISGGGTLVSHNMQKAGYFNVFLSIF